MTTSAPDLGPAARRLADLVRAVPDDRLADPTPCPGYTVGDLLDHLDGFAVAFTEAATKAGDASGSAAIGDASRLGDDWRDRIPAELDALAAAWRDPAASEGMTYAGGFEMPAAEAGVVALEELVVHGWDLAAATGQPFDAEPDALELVMGFFESFPDDPEVRGEAFGAPQPVAADAPLVHRALAVSGRDPGWRA